MKLSERALIHANKMDDEGLHVTANVLTACAEALNNFAQDCDMTYKLQPPFEIYHDGKQIADKDGHICSAENPEIAKAILAALEAVERLRPHLAAAADDQA